MATEHLTGEGLDTGDDVNIYESGPGDDLYDGANGKNVIVYELGDGVDTVTFAAPRTYQFAGYLIAAQEALDSASPGQSGDYSNDYFNEADSSLISRLPFQISTVLNGLQRKLGDDGGWVPGVVDWDSAQAAFNDLIAWINAPVTNLIRFGPNISPSDITIQTSLNTTSFGVPSSFVVAVGGDQGIVFNMLPPDLAAGAAPTPPPMDITFEFQNDDGSVSTATLAEILGLDSDGVSGDHTGTADGETMVGSLGDDQIRGRDGDDRIDGRAGMDGIYGDAGNDVLSGGAGMDIIYGDAGDDVIAAGPDGAFVSGGAGNDVYLFNAGDGTLFVDNMPGVTAGDRDTISFGGGIAPQNVMAYIDGTGTLTLFMPGSSDQMLLVWYSDLDNSGTLTENPEQTVSNVQFIDSSGNVRVFDLASLVHANEAALFGATLDNPVPLFDLGSGEITGTVATAGGEYATNYAASGNMFESDAPSARQPCAGDRHHARKRDLPGRRERFGVPAAERLQRPGRRRPELLRQPRRRQPAADLAALQL